MNIFLFSYKPLMLRVCYITPTQERFCLHVFCHAGPPRWVNCLAPRKEIRH